MVGDCAVPVESVGATNCGKLLVVLTVGNGGPVSTGARPLPPTNSPYTLCSWKSLAAGLTNKGSPTKLLPSVPAALCQAVSDVSFAPCHEPSTPTGMKRL